MEKKFVKDLAEIVLVPFMKIAPSDVLILKNLIHWFQANKPKNQSNYFLWAQDEGALTDILFQESKYKDDFDSNDTVSLKAHLFYTINNVKQSKDVYIQRRTIQSTDQMNMPLSYLLTDTKETINLCRLNISINYLNKACWVLRSANGSNLTPLTLSFFISDSVGKSYENYTSFDKVIEHILNLEVDIDKLESFEKNCARDFPKDIRYKYSSMYNNNYTSEWNTVLEKIEQPEISIIDLAHQFRKMGVAHFHTGDMFEKLNNKLGHLFLEHSESETFIKNQGLGYIYFGRKPEDYEQWVQYEIFARAINAIHTYNDIYETYLTKLVHFSSSPIERIFAYKLLNLLPTKDVIQKRATEIQKEEFSNMYRRVIEIGTKVLAGVEKGGKQYAEKIGPDIDKKVKLACEAIIHMHLEQKHLSFSAILDKVAKEFDIGSSTLRKYGVIKKSFPKW